ncbi:MAG: DNA-processing protein DprA [Ruminococcus sp.]|nr:DNA-processing protein DprA [Ruminococcus sp.]
MNNVKYWVWLTMVFGTGSRRVWDIMHLFEYAGYAYKEIKIGYLSQRLNENERRIANHITLEQAENHIEYCSSLGISVIGYGDSEYPRQLRNIYNPPAVLYCKGNASCLGSEKTVTSVGTRRASVYSTRVADRICRSLAQNGVVIVSGFAVGIDIASHLAAVSVNRPTICVMGCGLDVDYPKDNFRYRETVLKSQGLFVSEYPPGTAPHSQNFPKRNRILAALGMAALVFEGSNRSGSLITANLALDQGKEVFCLPPADIFSSSFSGNISMLRDGAKLLLSAEDVMECFESDDDGEYYDEADSDYYEELQAVVSDKIKYLEESGKKTEKIKISRKKNRHRRHRRQMRSFTNPCHRYSVRLSIRFQRKALFMGTL